ncbi:hypothetical protein ACKGJN_16150 [Gillisia sp. Q332]|uniref:hypothetical protein n=1 Tax=Gillisia xinjiangensis TaxID=3384765 RepID=UPI003919AD69
MKLTIVLINALFLLIVLKGFTQEIVIPKDTVYLNYSYYVNNCQHSDILSKLKWRKENVIQFNLCGEAIFIYPKNGDSDTLDIKNLKNYQFTEVNDIDSLGRLWYKKNLPVLKRKYGKIIAPHDKNGKFVTYLIEESNDCLIKYRVYWRNEHVID